MCEEQRPLISTTTEHHTVRLNRAQRRRLLVRASGWLGFGGSLVSCCCIYGPLTITWLIPATASLLVAVIGGIAIALADIAMVSALFFGLMLLQEGIVGAAVQAIDRVHVPHRSTLAAPVTVRAERAGQLRVATPTLVRTVRSGQPHTITYSPSARILWACSAIELIQP